MTATRKANQAAVDLQHWATPVLTMQFEQTQEVNAELLSILHTERRTSAGMHTSNVGAWQSQPTLLLRTEPAIQFIVEAIGMAAEHLLTQLLAGEPPAKAPAIVAEGWGLIYGEGDYSDPHLHYGAPWSGVYYIQADPTPDAGGQLELIDPRASAAHVNPDARIVRIAPRPGLLVMFPGWLRHWVTPCAANAKRVCIAFNAGYAT